MRAHCTVEMLAELGAQIDLLTFPIGKLVEIPGVNITRSKNYFGFESVPIGPSIKKIILDLSLFCQLIKLCKKNNYSAVHGIEEAGVVLPLILPKTKSALIVDMHSKMSEQLENRGGPFFYIFSRLMKVLEDFSIRKCNGVMTVADRFTEYAKGKNSSIPCSTIQDAPLSSENYYTNERVLEIKKLKKSAEGKIFLYTGNFYQYQGVDLLVKAFSIFNNRSHQKHILLIVGGDPITENNAKTELANLSKNLKSDSNIIFINQQPIEEIGNYMEAADFLVSPRITGENTPLKVYSYMQANKPIIATKILSHTQVLDQDSAILCEPSPESMAEAFEISLNLSKEEIDSLTYNSQLKAEKSYSKTAFKEKILSFYKQIIH